MPSSSGRLRHEAVDFAAVLAVWLLLSFTVGSAVAGVLELTAPFEQHPLETPLVVAGTVTAVLELLDRRPTLRRTAAFTAVDLLVTLCVLLPLAAVTRGAVATLAAADLATTAVAAWVVFAGGYDRVTDTSRTVLYRLTRRPPTDR